MHLPTIVKQMGKVEGESRVYIEDYVYTYLNEIKQKKYGFPVRVALYGHAFSKENKNFYLIYGASCIMEELENGRDQEEIRKKFFDGYSLIGYVNIYDKQEITETENGCYIFYEANVPMQNYMLSCYERKSKAVIKDENSTESNIGADFYRNLIQKILLGFAAIIAAIAVMTISNYNGMYDFAMMAASALQEVD